MGVVKRNEVSVGELGMMMGGVHKDKISVLILYFRRCKKNERYEKVQRTTHC